MAMNNPYQQYQQNTIMTCRPEELTLMLFEGCIKFINKAVFSLEKKDIQGTNNSLLRAQDIIDELNTTLNDSYEISKNLHSIYNYLKKRLVEGNVKKDKEILVEVLQLVTELKDTWKEAMSIAKSTL